MKKLWIVCKNELFRYFVSPLAYVYLLSFLLLNASFTLYFGDFFDRGEADLQSMFAFQPWLYLLFIPGISGQRNLEVKPLSNLSQCRFPSEL